VEGGVMGGYIGGLLMLIGYGCGFFGYAPLGAVLILIGFVCGLPAVIDSIAALRAA
jgi:hypothetical protein